MARQRSAPAPTGFTILVIDDNQDYLVAAERLLARCGHTVVAMSNPVEALELLRRRTFDLVLVDFFMPEMTGEALVAELRTFDPLVQVILQTGYATEMSPRELLLRMDIQGYYDKSEGPDKMLLWADVGLRAARTIRSLRKERDAQSAILEAALEMRSARGIEGIRDVVTARLPRLLELLASHRAPLGEPVHKHPDFVWARGADSSKLEIAFATGKLPRTGMLRAAVSKEAAQGIEEALSERAVQSGEWGTAAPLVFRGEVLGAIFLDAATSDPSDAALLRAFADQAAAALATAL